MQPAAIMSASFVVLKFGGTSVATPGRWGTILEQSRARRAEGLLPVVVCSALAGVSDLLERVALEATAGRHAPLLAELQRRHLELAAGLGVDGAAAIGPDLAEVERLALAASLTGEADPRLKARIMAIGEILSTRLGAAFMNARGEHVAWLDARTCLVSMGDETRGPVHRILNATVSDDRDPALAARLAQLDAEILLTQGFIARDPGGGTVLLGRGGSDTSAALFAAKLQAVRCEIWTDVPGIFTADPRLVPSALLVKAAGYGEAQEIASTGAKVLHPRCIAPCRRHRIPLQLRWAERPAFAGTIIERSAKAGQGLVKAITHKAGVVLVSMETPGMWQQVGFLADVFGCFKQRGISVDLVSTSETNVTASLDASANGLDQATLDGLVADLARHCRARIVTGCAAVSLVGRRIRAILHRLGPVLAVFEEQAVHLVSQAASDLNLTFVVDESQATRLVRELHELLFGGAVPDQAFGPCWRELFEGEPPVARAVEQPWWRVRRGELLALAEPGTPVYVHDLGVVDEALAALRAMAAPGRVLYALKANPATEVLQRVEAAGLGFECVSPGELACVRQLFPDIDPSRLLFTPNFAPRREYVEALAAGVSVTVDNLWALEEWPELFAGRPILLRLDPGTGRGHHVHVRTAGQRSKFGIAATEIDRAAEVAARAGAKVVGLHAHLGSGIRDVGSWAETALFLAHAAEGFPDARILNVGGGLAAPDRIGEAGLDLRAVDAALLGVRRAHPRHEIWLEPGRFVVALAGVLLARVTQIKRKDRVTFVGVDAGMNSLIRPALYGAYHEIVNLTRLDQRPTTTAHVVGPICEAGDVLGHARRLPPCREGDVLLVAGAGAYGASMASRYNLREPAPCRFLPPP
ncbi:MAG: bifunctional aspartate kinase/diaminopimelate decarboxylase [Deltaproteobacteria bacterium]|nr:bifunctional aspartate kinase/diaminopimelate decarboxylase [Deltaproteobacteria bacterium]